MEDKEFMIIADYSDENLLPLEEVCTICGVSSDFLVKLVRYEIIRPQGIFDDWAFDLRQVARIKTVLRLKHLEVNLQAIAIILDLLEEMENLRQQTNLYKRHLLK